MPSTRCWSRRSQATKSLSDDTLADYIRKSTFKTVLGDVRFGKFGEWAESRVLQVQFRGIKNNDPAQFKGIDTQAVVDPPAYDFGQRDLSVREGEMLKIRRRVRIGRRAA